MSICRYCNQEIEWRESKKTGKHYNMNTNKTLHHCPNYNKIKDNDHNNNSSNIETISEQSKAGITNEGELLDNKNIENARWFIDGLNRRLLRKRIAFVVEDKEVSH